MQSVLWDGGGGLPPWCTSPDGFTLILCPLLYLATFNQILLTLEVFVIILFASWFYRLRRYYSICLDDVFPLPVVLCRSQRRQPALNVFISGLSPRTLILRVPPTATGRWIFSELERRRLLPSLRSQNRLAFSLLFSPANSGLPRLLHDYQDLAKAGVRNNSTIYVRYCISGGARSGASSAAAGGSNLQQVRYYCQGVCGKWYTMAHHLRQHLSKSPDCQHRIAAAEAPSRLGKDISTRLAREHAPAAGSSSLAGAVAEKLARHGSAHSTSNPDTLQPDLMDVDDHASAKDRHGTHDDMDIDQYSDQPVRVRTGDEDDDDEEDDEGDEDPLGWKQRDLARARKIGQGARDLGDDLFDEEEEEEEEEERTNERIVQGGERDVPVEDENGGGGGGDAGGPGDGDDDDDDDDEPDGDPNPDPVPDPPPPQGNRRIEKFDGRAGEPFNGGVAVQDGFTKYESLLPDAQDVNNLYHPFASKRNWEFAAWAKEYGIGSNALNAFFKIDGVVDGLGLQFKNNTELNRIVDKALPPRDPFVRRVYQLGGETHEMYMRDTLAVVRELYGRPDFAKDMVFAPEKHYLLGDEEDEQRVFSEVNTGRWWWEMQKRLENSKPGATIVPLIISSDKTQLTQFGNRSAYPVYLTIGNISKEIRRKTSLNAQILIGYLPVTKLSNIKEDDLRRRALANLFHTCMLDLLKPLKKVAKHGVVLTSGDGVRRRCHPLLAAFVGDYPEQVLVTGVKNGRCPKGKIDPALLGTQEACQRRNHAAAAAALRRRDERPNDPKGFIDACAAAGVKPINAFWKDYPDADIYQSITPDILHQLYQGVVKHLIAWLKAVYGAKALDERFKCLPANHQLRQFSKGISVLSRVTGNEHQDICRVLLSVIADIPLPDHGDRKRVLKAVRALLDFVYLAQYPEASMDTLDQMEDALDRFHENKDVFVDLGAREHFNFPKMHALAHYVDSIQLFGTADNFNTSYSERLHIDCAKSAWRATNHRDAYPQMTLWLQRREQIHAHRRYIEWRLQNRPSVKDMPRAPLPRAPKLKKKIAKNPNIEYLSLESAAQLYGATNIRQKLAEYIVKTKFPNFTEHEVRNTAATYHIPFRSVGAFHRLKFWHPDALEREGDLVQELPDSVIVRPAYRDSQKRRVEGAFGTALIDERGDDKLRVGQVRVIFNLSDTARDRVFGAQAAQVPTHFAYVEWFSRFGTHPERWHSLHRIKRSFINNAQVQNERAAVILPIERIQRSVSLTPRFGRRVDPAWNAHNVLELCSDFYVNSYSDMHAYITMP